MCCVMALWENQNAIASVDRFSCISKALAETGFARERKEVQKRNTEHPLHAVICSAEKTPLWQGGAQSLQRFSSSCRSQLVANPRRKCGLHKSDVDVADVIADHEHWPAHSTQILAAPDARPSQQEHSGAHQQIMREQANPGHRPALYPSRIVIL